jgi:hypothetical protein
MEMLELLAYKGYKVTLELKDIQDYKAVKGILDRRDILDHRDTLVYKVLPD